MEYVVNICKVIIFLNLFFCTLGLRVKRKDGDQAPAGKCVTYKRGGESRLHWYACCNNCNEEDRSCDGDTYQSASSKRYCAKCGVDTKSGNGNEYATYSCGGCQGQSRTRQQCLSKIRSLYNIPGMCWAFAKCFRRKCGSELTPDTCFNLRCEPGETVSNCPSDCCGNENNKCIWEPDKCVLECCGESTCCYREGETAFTKDNSGSDGHVSFGMHYICLMGMIIIMIVINEDF